MVKEKSIVRVEVSTRQFLKVIVILGLIYFLFLIKGVLVLVFSSFILMAATRTVVFKIHEKLKLPLIMSVLVVYTSIISIFVGILYLTSSSLAAEFANLSENVTKLKDDIIETVPGVEEFFDESSINSSLSDIFGDLSSNFARIYTITTGAFDFIIGITSLMIISIYMFFERDKILNFIVKLLRLDQKNFINSYEKIELKIGAWVRGQLILSFAVGIATWIGAEAIGLEYAIPLAVLAGVFEIIPAIGPIISAVPLILVGLSDSLVTGLLALGLSILVQQLENNLLVPHIMKKSVGLSPVTTLVSVMMGKALFGIYGMILAVPVAAMGYVLMEIYLENRDNGVNGTKNKLNLNTKDPTKHNKEKKVRRDSG